MSAEQLVLDGTSDETMQDDCVATASNEHYGSRMAGLGPVGDLHQANAAHPAERSGDVPGQEREPFLLDRLSSNVRAEAGDRNPGGTPPPNGHTSRDGFPPPEIGFSPASVASLSKQNKRKRAQASFEEGSEACLQNAEHKIPRILAPAQHQQIRSAPSVHRSSPRLPLQTHASLLQLRQIPLEQALSRRRTFSPLTSVAPRPSYARPFWAALQPASNVQASRENHVVSDRQREARCSESQTLRPENGIDDAVTLNDGERKTGVQPVPAKEAKAHASTEREQDRANRLQVKAKALKIFLEGLGKDMQTLKQDLIAHQRSTDQAVAESAKQPDVQKALLEKATKLQSEALRIARDATNNLAALQTRNKLLEEQLHDQINIMSSEKNIRLELQAQLSSTANHDLRPEISAHTNKILDKLYEIHAEMDDKGKDVSAETLEKLLAATNDLNSQQVATVESVASIKAVLESFSSSLAAQAGTPDSSARIESSLKIHFDEALNTLSAKLSQQDKLSEQVVVDRETIMHLKQQLQATKDEATELAVNLEARTRELAALQGQHAAVQTQFAAQSKSCEDKHSEKLARTEVQLQEKARALQTTESNLAAISVEYGSLRANVVSLQKELSDWTAHVCPELDQQQFEDRLLAAVETAKKETIKAANGLHKQTKLENENKLKQAITKVGRLEAELVSARRETAIPPAHQNELHRLQELARNKEADVQRLNARTNELVTSKNHFEQTYLSLNAQHEAQKQHLQDALEGKQRLGQELGSTKDQLRKTNQQLQVAESKLEQDQTDARRKLEDKEATCKRRVESLEHRIEGMEADLLKHAEARRKHEQDLERSRADRRQAHEDEMARLTNLVDESEREKTRALAECQRLSDELSVMESMPGSAQGVHGKPHTTSSTVIVPNSQQSSTALGANRSWTTAIHRGEDPLATTPCQQPGQVSRQDIEGTNALAAVVEDSQFGTLGFITQDAIMSQGSLGPVVEESQRWDTLVFHQDGIFSPLVSRQDYGLGADNGSNTEHQLDERFTFPSTARSCRATQKLLPLASFDANKPTSPQNAIHRARPVGSAAVANSQRDQVHDRDNTCSRMPRPNSSAKRLKPGSVPQKTNSSEDRFLPQYVTPEPRGQGSGTAGPTLAIGQSSSPDVITNRPVNMSFSNGKRAADTDGRARGATSQIKHKADRELTLGNGLQRRSHSQQTTRPVAGMRTQQTRGTKSMTKDQRMSARFARELQ
ncbi:hypothetical protein BST61_g5420 [Cercospora zeina]